MNAMDVPIHGRYRRLHNNERKFLFTPMANISIVARIRGRVDEQALHEAIGKIRIRHPLSAVHVVFDSDRSAWFHTDGAPPIPLRVVPRRSDTQWIEEVRREHQLPFSPFTDPMLRFVLIRSSEVSDLVVFAQHAVCDGTGLAYLMRDVLLHLADPTLEARPLPAPPSLTPENLPDGVRENPAVKFIRQIYSRQLNRAWQKNPFLFDAEDLRAIQQAFFAKYHYCVVTAELSASATADLIADCRKWGVSVNSALTTAFIAAFQEQVGPLQGSKRKVAVPVDMRKRLGRTVEDVLDLYVGAVMFDFPYGGRKPFWENVRAFHRIAHREMDSLACFEVMYAMEDIDGTLMDVLMGFGLMSRLVPPSAARYEKISAFARDRKNPANQLAGRFAKQLPGVVNTNLGNLNFPERYGGLELERLFFAPPTGPDFSLVIGAATTSGRLSLTLNFVEEAVDTQTMTAVRDRALELLDLPGGGTE